MNYVLHFLLEVVEKQRPGLIIWLLKIFPGLFRRLRKNTSQLGIFCRMNLEKSVESGIIVHDMGFAVL